MNEIIFIDDIEFRVIPEFEDYAIGFKGDLYSFKSGRILKTYKISKGYIGCKLFNNKKKLSQRIHRLVAQAFIPNPENKPQVNHIDSDKSNNNVNNLEWVSNQENVHHGSLSKLSLKNVEEIRDLIRSGSTIYKLAEIFEVSVSTISHIKTGRNWTDRSTLTDEEDKK